MPVVNFYTPDKIDTKPLSYFFNSIEYQRLFDSENTHSFYLKDSDENVLARIHFIIEGDLANSFRKAPFGFLEAGIENSSALSAFINKVEDHLKTLSVNSIELRCWPECYDPLQTRLISRILFDCNYKIEFSDYNFFQAVTNKSSIELYKKPERKRLRKCINADFQFVQLIEPEPGTVYDFLIKFRNQKHIPLNISRLDIQKAISRYPNQYFVFELRDKNRVVGISVCVEVNQDILYHFVMATDLEYNNYSPGVMLYDGIYKFCQDRNYKIFDFGTASIEGKKQEGLFAFKENLGGMISSKPFFSKKL